MTGKPENQKPETCRRCKGVGFVPDTCRACGSQFDPRLEVYLMRNLPCGHADSQLMEGYPCNHDQSARRGYTKKDFSRAIREAWLPLTGKRKLSSHEYRLIDQWFEEGTQLALVLRAIKQVAGRGSTVYSLGVIKPDMEAIKRQWAKSNVGGAMTGASENWREEWAESLDDLAESDPTRAKKYRELKAALPRLGFEQVKERFRRI